MELLEAARYGEDEELKELLKNADADLGFRDSYGNTALHMACANGHLSIVRILLSSSSVNTEGKKADINAVNEHGNTAIHWICAQPTVNSAHEEIVKLLIEAGANINIKNGKNRTALDEANDKGHSSICQILVQHEARVGGINEGEKDDFFDEKEGAKSASMKKNSSRFEEVTDEIVEDEDSNTTIHGAHEKKGTTTTTTTSDHQEKEEKEQNNVIICGNKACGLREEKGQTFSRCSRCKKLYYCGRECQRRDWASHKLSCVPPS